MPLPRSIGALVIGFERIAAALPSGKVARLRQIGKCASQPHTGATICSKSLLNVVTPQLGQVAELPSRLPDEAPPCENKAAFFARASYWHFKCIR
jgi:hypothetical protein